MRWWLSLAMLCAMSALAWPGRADPAFFADASGVGPCTERCPSSRSRVLPAVPGQGKLQKVSGKSRRIAARLDATGYYSYLSRALKGYPHLRSKPVRPMAPDRPIRLAGIKSENRKRFSPHILTVARAHRLDPKLIDAVISVESAYDPNAVSSKGALGLMQLMPDTAKRFDVADPFDPIANMRGGARYLRWLMDRFENDLDLVLAAYNAGEGALEEYGNTIPPYAETRTYVTRVRKLYEAIGGGR